MQLIISRNHELQERDAGGADIDQVWAANKERNTARRNHCSEMLKQMWGKFCTSCGCVVD
jgi:hypothetical protein